MYLDMTRVYAEFKPLLENMLQFANTNDQDFIYGLSNDTASSLFYTASNDWMIVNNGLEC